MEALGINLTWFLFQLGNFVVLLAILTKLLHKPLIKLLDSRKEEIAEGIRGAENAKLQLESIKEQQAQLLDETRKESAAILKQTKQRAEELEAALKTESQKKTEALRVSSEQQIAAEREQLKLELKKELAEMVVAATEKVLKESSGNDRKKSIAKSLESL